MITVRGAHWYKTFMVHIYGEDHIPQKTCKMYVKDHFHLAAIPLTQMGRSWPYDGSDSAWGGEYSYLQILKEYFVKKFQTDLY